MSTWTRLEGPGQPRFDDVGDVSPEALERLRENELEAQDRPDEPTPTVDADRSGDPE